MLILLNSMETKLEKHCSEANHYQRTTIVNLYTKSCAFVVEDDVRDFEDPIRAAVSFFFFVKM